MGEIVTLDVNTTLDIPPEKILSRALERKFDQVMVLGCDTEGELYFSSSTADVGNMLFMIEKFKLRLLSDED